MIKAWGSWRVRRVVQYAVVVLFIWTALVYFFPSWDDIESMEKLKEVQRRHKEMLKKSHLSQLMNQKKREQQMNSGRRANAIDDDEEEKKPGKNGYANSKTLQERLKPKLVNGGFRRSDDGDDDNFWNDLGAARSNEDVLVREEGYRKFAFNSLVSNRLGFRPREVKDTRHAECKKKSYPDDDELPTASVVICYYHEELMTLLRTVHSVVERSPAKLLREVNNSKK